MLACWLALCLSLKQLQQRHKIWFELDSSPSSATKVVLSEILLRADDFAQIWLLQDLLQNTLGLCLICHSNTMELIKCN